jgi:hypothetical protein
MSLHHTQRLRRGTAGALAALALAASPAAATPALDPVHHDSAMPAPAEVVDASTGGFVWGSALIGAGAATAVCLLTGAGVTTASRRHRREPRPTTASVA